MASQQALTSINPSIPSSMRRHRHYKKITALNLTQEETLSRQVPINPMFPVKYHQLTVGRKPLPASPHWIHQERLSFEENKVETRWLAVGLPGIGSDLQQFADRHVCRHSKERLIPGKGEAWSIACYGRGANQGEDGAETCLPSFPYSYPSELHQVPDQVCVVVHRRTDCESVWEVLWAPAHLWVQPWPDYDLAWVWDGGRASWEAEIEAEGEAQHTGAAVFQYHVDRVLARDVEVEDGEIAPRLLPHLQDHRGHQHAMHVRLRHPTETAQAWADHMHDAWVSLEAQGHLRDQALPQTLLASQRVQPDRNRPATRPFPTPDRNLQEKQQPHRKGLWDRATVLVVAPLHAAAQFFREEENVDWWVGCVEVWGSGGAVLPGEQAEEGVHFRTVQGHLCGVVWRA